MGLKLQCKVSGGSTCSEEHSPPPPSPQHIRWTGAKLQAGMWGRDRLDTLLWGEEEQELGGGSQEAGGVQKTPQQQAGKI